MTSTNPHAIHLFNLSNEGAALPEWKLREGVQVKYLDWEIASDEGYAGVHGDLAVAALKRAGVSVDTHVVVGSYFQDFSGWCDIEQKVEYYSETTYLVVPREVVSPTFVGEVWCDAAAEAGFSDWA